jgi:hypothetical protein
VLPLREAGFNAAQQNTQGYQNNPACPDTGIRLSVRRLWTPLIVNVSVVCYVACLVRFTAAMGTEDETELTLQGRATAAAGAALVAACIVNPLDVIKVCLSCSSAALSGQVSGSCADVVMLLLQTRIQAQAMAEASGQRGCSTPWICTSTLYE